MGRFILREANLYEYDDIKKFYDNNRDSHVMIRAEETIKCSINDGLFFIALDTSRTDGDRIFGASSIYSISIRDDNGKSIILKEAGGTLLSLEYRYFSIHKMFLCARILHEHILDRGGFSELFVSIRCPNPASESNVQKAGFVEWTDAPQQLRAERNLHLEEGQSIKLFRFQIECLSGLAKEMLFYVNRGKVSRQTEEGYQEQQIVFDLQLCKLYRPILERLSHGDMTVLE